MNFLDKEYINIKMIPIVEVCMWIVLAISISSDFWLRWLVYEA
jgi:hypothetical protein